MALSPPTTASSSTGDDPAEAGVDRFDRPDRRLPDPRVADHIGIREVGDDQVVLVTLDRVDDDYADQRRSAQALDPPAGRRKLEHEGSLSVN